MKIDKTAILLSLFITHLLIENLFAATIDPNSSSVTTEFINLDFESGSVEGVSESFPMLDWAIGAPGWSNSSGSDTESLYYHGNHIGGSQWFRLNDGIVGAALAGNYSLSFKSGVKQELGPDNSWVNAYIAQTGYIPTDVKSLRLLSTGPLGVWLGDDQIALTELGNNAWMADISAYAGLTKELRLVNLADFAYGPVPEEAYIVTVDNIQFSTTPVPLLPSALFMISGLGILTFRRNQHAIKQGN